MSFNHKNKRKCYQTIITILSNLEPFPGQPFHTYMCPVRRVGCERIRDFAFRVQSCQTFWCQSSTGVGVWVWVSASASASVSARVRVSASARVSVATGLNWMGNVHIMAPTLNSHPNSHIMHIAKGLRLGIRD